MSRKGRTSLLCWWSLQWWRVYIDSFFLQKEKHLEDKLSIALITSLDFPFYMRNWKIMWIYKTVSRTNSELDKLEVFISFFLTFIYEIVTSKFQTIFFLKKKITCVFLYLYLNYVSWDWAGSRGVTESFFHWLRAWSHLWIALIRKIYGINPKFWTNEKCKWILEEPRDLVSV